MKSIPMDHKWLRQQIDDAHRCAQFDTHTATRGEVAKGLYRRNMDLMDKLITVGQERDLHFARAERTETRFYWACIGAAMLGCVALAEGVLLWWWL